MTKKRINILFARANKKRDLANQISSLIKYGEDNKLPDFFLYSELVGADSSDIITRLINQTQKSRINAVYITKDTIFFSNEYTPSQITSILQEFGVKLIVIN